MTEYIDEGIIPYNMTWRVGIGKDTSQVNHDQMSNPYQPEELYDGGIKLTREKIVPKYPYANVDLSESLLPEIDAQVSEALEKYKYEPINGKLLLMVKEELKRICLNIKAKYRMYMTESFYNKLYSQCKTAYEQNFVTLKEGINALTEFVEINGELYGNPLLIYGYFQL